MLGSSLTGHEVLSKQLMASKAQHSDLQNGLMAGWAEWAEWADGLISRAAISLRQMCEEHQQQRPLTQYFAVA